MAKLNWQNVWQKTQAEMNALPDATTLRADKYFTHKGRQKTLKSGIWPTGKYKGIPVSELPEQYLIWAGQNLKIDYLRHQANKELIHRYHTGKIIINNT